MAIFFPPFQRFALIRGVPALFSQNILEIQKGVYDEIVSLLFLINNGSWYDLKSYWAF